MLLLTGRTPKLFISPLAVLFMPWYGKTHHEPLKIFANGIAHLKLLLNAVSDLLTVSTDNCLNKKGHISSKEYGD